MPSMSVLIGREAAVHATARLLDLTAGRPPVHVIEGEAGMGKTAVWLRAVAAAEERGHRVLQARPAESEAGLAYAGITDLVGTVFDEERAALPPPQSRALGAALLRAEDDQPVELRAVATAFTTVLGQLAARTPVLVAVDDVQWLDRASERVLGFAARRLPAGVRLLLAVRSDLAGSSSHLLSTLPTDLAENVPLGPLSLAALHHLVHQRVGLSLTRPLLNRLAAASGGNPLFALEIGRALAAGSRDLSVDPMPVPSTLQRMVATRVEALSGAAREMLLVSAALSRPTPAEVARVLPPAVAEAALAEARQADVIVVTDGRIRFAHPLLASAVYGAASTDARRALHLRLAGLVEDPDERARHLAAGSLEPDGAVSGELERAGDRAAIRGAQDMAAELFAASWRLTPSEAVEDVVRRMLAQAFALNAVGDFAGSRSMAEQSLEIAPTPATRTRALSLLASIEWFNGAAGAATRLAETAVKEAGDDPALLGPLHAQLVRLNFAWNLRSALEHADLATTLLDPDQGAATLAQVMVDRLFGSALRGEPVPAGLLDRALALEAHAPVTAAPQPMPLLWFHCTDDYAAVQARFETEEPWYRERGEEVWVADRLSHLAVAELHAGRWDDAERHVEESCAAVEQLDIGGPRVMVFEKQALVDAHRGRLDRGRTTLHRLLAGFETTAQDWWAALTLSTLAFLEFAAGDLRAADEAVVRMHALADRIGAVDVLFDRSEPFHVEALIALGELTRARAALARLEARGERLPRPWIAQTLPRARALIAVEDGDLASALAQLSDLENTGAGTLPFELGWSLLVRGRIERRTRQKRASAETLAQALTIFEQLGAPGFAERTRHELARVGPRHSPTGLTPSEARVARLAASGMSNREVAQAAFISQKTVEANLARVYRKLGIRSRAELGSRMGGAPREAPPQK